jgi:hypothetical protein
LIAALIAAAAAMGSLVVNVVVAGRRERRNAHRKALEAELPDLADTLHQIVATSVTQRRQLVEGRTESAANWRRRGQSAAKKLATVRPRVRYSLPGVDMALRNLTRMPDWVASQGARPEGQTLLDQADALATALHELIEASWRSGRAPSRAERRRIESLVARLREYAPIVVHTQALTEEPEAGD